MSNLITSEALTQELELYIPIASKINIISAFFTMPAYRWLSDLSVTNSPSTNLVGRFTPKDFVVGVSSLEAIRLSLEDGHCVKALSNLHAKIFQIDSDVIYTGSANMTGKGLSLVENSNLEACTRVEPTNESKAFINKIITSSIELNLEHLDKMQSFIDNLNPSDEVQIPDNWPEEIMPKLTDIFVSDFPLTLPGETCEQYSVSPSLEFAIIEKNKTDFKYAKALFKSSKVYCWLIKILIEHDEVRDLGFGQITALLHDALCDDPAPYRRDIKTLQANFYKYIELYADDEIEIYVPGRKSQVLRFIKPQKGKITYEKYS